MRIDLKDTLPKLMNNFRYSNDLMKRKFFGLIYWHVYDINYEVIENSSEFKFPLYINHYSNEILWRKWSIMFKNIRLWRIAPTSMISFVDGNYCTV